MGLWHPHEKPMYGVLLNPHHPLAQGLVGCWLFNEGGGNIVYDLSGHGNHGTLGGGTAGYCPSWVAGKFGSALDFDGDNDYVEISHDPSIDFGDGSFTILLWVKGSSNDMDYEDRLFCKGTTSGGCGGGKRYEVSFTAPSSSWIVFTIDDNVTKSYIQRSNSPYLDNNWHQAVFLRDAENNKLKMFRDGKQDGAAVTDDTGDISNPCNLYFARRDPSESSPFLKISLDSVLMYNRALSEEEIWQLYTDPFCMFYHPLEAELLYAAAPSAVGTPTLTLLGVGR